MPASLGDSQASEGYEMRSTPSVSLGHDDIHHALLTIGCILISCNSRQIHFCWKLQSSPRIPRGLDHIDQTAVETSVSAADHNEARFSWGTPGPS